MTPLTHFGSHSYHGSLSLMFQKKDKVEINNKSLVDENKKS
jgi:hypothetical protein